MHVYLDNWMPQQLFYGPVAVFCPYSSRQSSQTTTWTRRGVAKVQYQTSQGGMVTGPRQQLNRDIKNMIFISSSPANFPLFGLVCIDKPIHTNLFTMYWYVLCLYLKFVFLIETPDIWIHLSIHSQY